MLLQEMPEDQHRQLDLHGNTVSSQWSSSAKHALGPLQVAPWACIAASEQPTQHHSAVKQTQSLLLHQGPDQDEVSELAVGVAVM